MKQKIAKIIVSTILVVLMIMFTTTFAKGQLITDEKGFVFEEETGTIVEYIGTTNNVVIPETINDITVLAIGEDAFRYANTVLVVTLPKTITDIDFTAFSQCLNLNTINVDPENKNFTGENGVLYDKKKFLLHTYPSDYGTTEFAIPHPVQTIGSYAFYNVGELTSITFPESCHTIMPYAFSGCKSLNNVNLPKEMSRIDAYAFDACESFVEISLPKGITTISEGVFNDAKGLQSIELSETTTTISTNAFKGCEDLVTIKLPETVTYIGESAFKNCQSLETIVLPSRLSFLGNSAFMGSTGLVEVTYTGDSLKQINAYSFKDCSSLVTIDFSYSVQRIQQEAFSGCSNLEQITIPYSVYQIGPYAFKDCDELVEVTLGKSVIDIDENTFDKTGQTKIISQANTYAINFAKNNHLPYMETSLSYYPISQEAYAIRLSKIDVFKGTDQGYELDRAPTRIEGLIMLIRLLGKESYALDMANDPCVFTDVPDWAKGYVNFAYVNGYTKGIGNDLFGTYDEMSHNAYMTFMLRALNYTEHIHFAWSEATNYAYEAGVIELQLHDELVSQPFVRGHIAHVSYETLLANLNNSVLTLGESLVNKHVINKDLARELDIIE